MFHRFVGALAGSLLFGAVLVLAGEDAPSWHAVEIVAFTDFDDLQVKLDGTVHKAYLAGLRPLRETVKDKVQRERLGQDIAAKLKKNRLFARILTTPGAEAVGLSADTFQHHKNDFAHGWDPNKYQYCWSGWGAYNLNTYFLHARTTNFLDNLGDREAEKNYREWFRQAVKAIEAKDKQ